MQLDNIFLLARLIGCTLQGHKLVKNDSIYGLSIDSYIFEILGVLSWIFASLSYNTDPLVHSQYSKRYPISPKIVNDRISLIIRVFMLICLIVNDSYSLKLRRTRHTKQNPSIMSLIIISILFVTPFFILSNTHRSRNMGKHGLFYLDLVGFCWFAGDLCSYVRFISQITMNWETMNTGMLCISTIFIEFLCSLTSTVIRMSSSPEHDEIPIDRRSTFAEMISIPLTLILLLQFRVYRKSPRLVKSYDLLKSEQYVE